MDRVTGLETEFAVFAAPAAPI
ncbi:hypothetical protein, partial [Actinomyces slackii]